MIRCIQIQPLLCLFSFAHENPHHLKYHFPLSSEVQTLLLLENPIQIHPLLKIAKGFKLLSLLEAFFTLSNLTAYFHVMIIFNITQLDTYGLYFFFLVKEHASCRQLSQSLYSHSATDSGPASDGIPQKKSPLVKLLLGA